MATLEQTYIAGAIVTATYEATIAYAVTVPSSTERGCSIARCQATFCIKNHQHNSPEEVDRRKEKSNSHEPQTSIRALQPTTDE